MMENIIYKGFEFNLIYRCSYSSLFYNSNLEMVLCIADVEYIPIENFKTIFDSISELIEKHSIKHLLFDKRNLRTFHQPSMEWYFAVWKQSIKEKGLVNHYKILPDLEWFVQAVNAGKHEIFKKYNSNLLNGIRVSYVDTIEKAIDDILISTNN
ncbi:MAG: hypothetical protein V4565_11175 [Bacteroidota bacterium]